MAMFRAKAEREKEVMKYNHINDVCSFVIE
jgi:hypothetical protein